MNTVFRGFRSTGISPGDRTLFMPDSEELAPAIRAGVCKKSGGHYAGILRHRRREVISQHTHMHFPATENSWQSGNNRNFRGRNMSLPAARQALTTGIQRFSGNVRIFLRGSQVTTPASIRKTDSFVEKHVVLSTPSGAITEASRLGFD